MNENLEVFIEIRPILRTIVAFALFLRSGLVDSDYIPATYSLADQFLDVLGSDLKNV